MQLDDVSAKKSVAPLDRGDRYTIRSLVRAISILNLLGTPTAADGLSVTQIAEAVGLSKSTTFAILQTLLDADFVTDTATGRGRRYSLGRAIGDLGAKVAPGQSINAIALPIMRDLADELQLSVRLGKVTQGSVEIVERVESPSGLQIDLRMGEKELLHSTAVGKAILATWPDDVILKTLGPAPLEARTDRTLTDPRDVLAEIAMVRSRKYAVDDEEDFAGIMCVGAAVASAGEAGEYGLSTTTLKASVTYERVKQIGTILRIGAERLNAAIDAERGEKHRRVAKSPARSNRS